ncbi:MAG: hypothetical protein ABIQ93_09985 [Saprospiraceae bacterium]
MFRFAKDSSLLLACHLTGTYDVNRRQTLPDDDYSLVKDWASSIADAGLQGVLFHNNFSDATCEKNQNAHLRFVRVAPAATYNPNVARYFIYRDFIRQYGDLLSSFFVTDVTDVVLLRNPFAASFFKARPNMIFCGDESKCLDDAWMMDHSTHLRSRIADFADYEAHFSQATLLNCGIFGGNRRLMQDFMHQLCLIHQQYNHDNRSAYTGDMGAFNYLVRTRFHEQVYHGAPVNTVFKGYEVDRQDCWFRHK